jgi:DNA-binding response OmpR family regulator
VPRVIICTETPLPDEVQTTALWRDDVVREVVASAVETLVRASATNPHLIVIDSSLPEAEQLIHDLRAHPATRSTSIAVLARSDFAISELELMAAGANAILSLPADPEWNDRLAVLMSVAPRRASRLAVTLQFEAAEGDNITTVAGTVLNLSERGMLVETDLELAIGTDIDFKIHLRDVAQPLVGCGQIVRQQGPRRCGVHFYGLEADGLERVRRFVDANN